MLFGKSTSKLASSKFDLCLWTPKIFSRMNFVKVMHSVFVRFTLVFETTNTNNCLNQSFEGVPMLDFGSISVPTGNQAGPSRQMYRNEDDYDPKTIRDLLYNNPRERALLKERNPPLSEALESGSTG